MRQSKLRPSRRPPESYRFPGDDGNFLPRHRSRIYLQQYAHFPFVNSFPSRGSLLESKSLFSDRGQRTWNCAAQLRSGPVRLQHQPTDTLESRLGFGGCLFQRRGHDNGRRGEPLLRLRIKQHLSKRQLKVTGKHIAADQTLTEQKYRHLDAMGIDIGLYPGKFVFLRKLRISKLTLQQAQSRIGAISYERGHRQICESVIRLAIRIPKTHQFIGGGAYHRGVLN